MDPMRRLLHALLLAGLAASLAACGSAVKNAVDPVAAAATKSQTAGGFKTSVSVTLAAGGKQFTITGHGAFGAHEGEMEMDMGGLLGQAGAPAGTDSTMKAVYVTEDGDPVMYLKFGLLTSLMPGGKPWMRLDLQKAGKAAGVDLGGLLGGGSQNATDSLALLRHAGDFSSVGSETVGGVETTHYRGTIDLEKAAESGGASADTIKRLLESGPPTQYPADVWIDDSGLIRRLTTSYDESLGGKTMSMSMTMDMSDYGAAVDVSAPPANQVFDVTEMAAKGITSSLNSGPSS
jgi:hypothetical protein